MRKNVVTSIILLSLVISGISTKADDSFVYHSSIVEGLKFNWLIESTLESGESLEIEDGVNLSLPLEDGDNISVEIIEDPTDPAITDPIDVLDITANGESISLLPWLGLILIMIDYGFDGYIIPIRDDTRNVSSVYQNMQEIQENKNDREDMTAIILGGESRALFSVIHHWEFDTGNGTTNYLLDYYFDTGFLFEFKIEVKKDSTNGYSSDSFDIVFEDYEPIFTISYNWGFVLIGFIALVIPVITIKRRRK